jgi:4-amino-4-deoxy-L-arabinose transferase-like glycosyltransferase
MLAVVWLVYLLALHWNSFTMPLDRDEGEYAYSAWLLRQGQMPYVHAFMQKPPMIIYTYAFAQVVGGDSVVPPRALAFLFLLLSTLLLTEAVRRRYGKAPAFALLWLFPIMAMAAHVSPFAANTERFMLLPLCGFLAVLDRPGEKSVWTWFWAGVLGALAVLYKPIPLLVVGFVSIYWMAETWKLKRGFPVRPLLAQAAGALAAALLSNLYFVARGAGSALWECAVAFNVYYTQALRHDSAFLWGHLRNFLAGWWVLIPFAAYFGYKRPAHWLLYVLATVIGALSVRQTLVSHYYLLLVPFLAMMAALGLAALAEDVASRRFASGGGKAKEIAVRVAVVAVLAGLVFSAPKQYTLMPEALNVWIYRAPLVNPFVEAPVVGAKLAAITRPEDRVLIFGSEPEVLHYAKRQSATRFVIMAPFLVRSPFYPGYRQTLLQELSNSPPAAIVITPHSMGTMANNPEGSQWLQELLATELKQFDPVGGYVSSGAESRWKEPLPPEDAASATFIVCRRVRPARE